MSNNELDLGCEAGQTIVHASPAQPMEVDEPSVSSCAGLPAIPVTDYVSPMSKGGLPRASQRLEDLTSHGLTRGTLQIRPSPQEMWLHSVALGCSSLEFLSCLVRSEGSRVRTNCFGSLANATSLSFGYSGLRRTSCSSGFLFKTTRQHSLASPCSSVGALWTRSSRCGLWWTK